MPERWCRRRAVAAVLAPAALAACAVVGPEYEPSRPELPAAYDAPVPALFENGRRDGPWWTLFDDPLLDELVSRGLDGNLDVRVALSRVREAQAVARGVAAGTGPSLDGSVEARGQAQLAGDDDADDEGASLQGLLSGEWEIDLFGGLYRTRQAAWARVGVEEALGREARRLAAAEIVRQYVQMRAAERRLELIRGSIALQQRTLELVDKRVEAGLSPGLDRVRARAAVARLRAEVGPLGTQIARARNALAVLLAAAPGALDAMLEVEEPAIPAAAAGRALGVPADLVRRRPDIQAAEYRIAAATADVGVAVADLYPRLTLPGSIGVGWDGIDEDSVVTTVLAALSALFEMPLYDGGERDAAVDAAQERLVQATLAYRLRLLSALEEVESALVGYAGALSRREALEETVRNNRLAFEQSGELYRQGLVSFLDVLDSQREWNVSLQELATAERDLTLEVANLFTALGGTEAALP